MKILGLMSTFILNFLFMMLTTLLPILVYNVTKSYSNVGSVLFIFTVTILITRLILWHVKLDYRVLFFLGSACLLLCFICLSLYSNVFYAYYIGSMLLGMAIGILPPLQLGYMTTGDKKEKGQNISLYNSVIALSSISAPFTGEWLFKHLENTLFLIWIVLSVLLLFLNLIIAYHYNSQLSNTVTLEQPTKYNIVDLKIFILPLLILTTISITYGTIISYLPIYLDDISASIGVFYFFFWAAYIGSQFVKIRGINFTKFNILLITLIISLVLISLFKVHAIIYFSGIMYGFIFGTVFKLYYLKVSELPTEIEKNNGYGIIGLMSYIGVGLAAIFTLPFMIFSIQYIFMFSSIYMIPFIIIIWRKTKNER